MGFFGTLFGSEKTIDKATDGIVSGVDAMFFTNEEKAAAAKEMVLKLQDQYSPRALSRRIIAIMLIALFIVYAIAGLAFACFSQFEVVKAIVDLAKAWGLGWIVGTVVVFYFGYYGLKQAFAKKG